MAPSSSARIYYLGVFILACLMLGGGTEKGLPTLFILQLLALPMLVLLVIDSPDAPRLPYGASWLLVGVCAIAAIQLMPLGWGRAAAEGLQGLALSLDMGRTLDTLAFFIVPASFFLLVARSGVNGQNRLLPFFFLGVLINLVLALVQFAASRGLQLGLFPYNLGAGFFANQNHFSSLLYAAIPFVVYQVWAIDRLWMSLPVVALIIFVEFAAGSMAGILISVGCVMISYAVLVPMGILPRIAIFASTIVGAIFIGLNIEALDPGMGGALGRSTFLTTTLSAIPSFLPWGSGLGTFPITYPQFEQSGQIFGSFANHAHNEYLELLLEGGLPVLALLLAYGAMLFSRLRNGPIDSFTRAALCAIGFILIHSLVDYPLRTMGIAICFAYFNAIVFSVVDPAAVPLRRRRLRSA